MEALHKRPGIKLVHTFRAEVTAMTVYDGRLLVTLENGKAYRSNLKCTRWYRLTPATCTSAA